MKSFLLFLLVLFISFSAYSNDKKDKISVRMGVHTVNTEKIPSKIQTQIPAIGIGLDYEFVENMQIGLYASFTIMDYHIPLEKDSTNKYVLYDNSGELKVRSNSGYFRTNASVLFYGISARYSINQLFWRNENEKFDLYVMSKVGLVSAYAKVFDGYHFVGEWKSPSYEYNVGFGTFYRFSSGFGIFAEYGVGKYYNGAKSNLNAGLIFTF